MQAKFRCKGEGAKENNIEKNTDSQITLKSFIHQTHHNLIEQKLKSRIRSQHNIRSEVKQDVTAFEVQPL